MVSELKGPTHSQIKQYILDKAILEIKLTNSEILSGRIIWMDETAIFIETEDDKKITIPFNSLLYYYKKN